MRARSSVSGTLSVEAVRVLLLGGAARGLSPPELCARFEIDPVLLGDVDARVPVDLVVALWNELPGLCGDEDFGLHLAEMAAAGPLGLGGHLIASAATLGEGIARLLRYERVFHDVNTSELHRQGGCARLVHDTRGTLPLPRHAAEFAWAWVVCLARRTTGAPLEPQAVRFAHSRPARVTEHERIFGVVPAFDTEVHEMIVDEGALDRPHLAADPALAEVLESHARLLFERLPASTDLTAQVRHAVYHLLADGDLGLAAVADRLGVPVRTLQRRLRDEGTSYQQVLDELRRELAARYVRDRRFGLSEVAFALGFADQSSFHRAFVRWTGKTPGEFRRAGD